MNKKWNSIKAVQIHCKIQIYLKMIIIQLTIIATEQRFKIEITET